MRVIDQTLTHVRLEAVEGILCERSLKVAICDQ